MHTPALHFPIPEQQLGHVVTLLIVAVRLNWTGSKDDPDVKIAAIAIKYVFPWQGPIVKRDPPLSRLLTKLK